MLDHTVTELCELFSIGRATVYWAIARQPETAAAAVTLPLVDSDGGR